MSEGKRPKCQSARTEPTNGPLALPGQVQCVRCGWVFFKSELGALAR